MPYFSRGMEDEKVANSKSDLQSTQGHWYWCYSIGRMSFPLQQRLYRVPF